MWHVQAEEQRRGGNRPHGGLLEGQVGLACFQVLIFKLKRLVFRFSLCCVLATCWGVFAVRGFRTGPEPDSLGSVNQWPLIAVGWRTGDEEGDGCVRELMRPLTG